MDFYKRKNNTICRIKDLCQREMSVNLIKKVILESYECGFSARFVEKYLANLVNDGIIQICPKGKVKWLLKEEGRATKKDETEDTTANH